MDIIEREEKKYSLLYKEDQSYGVRKNKPITNIRGNKKVRKKLKKVFLDSKKALDIGCGRCFYSKYLKEEYPNLEITGLDIAGKEILRDYPELNIVSSSCHKMPFKEKEFDLVFHLDGLEHIPLEIEEQVLLEQYRVSSKWIYNQISLNSVSIDEYWISKGLGAIHINLKTKEEWENKFNEFSKKYRLKKKFFIEYKNWLHVLLEK